MGQAVSRIASTSWQPDVLLQPADGRSDALHRQPGFSESRHDVRLGEADKRDADAVRPGRLQGRDDGRRDNVRAVEAL
jgi:hypothetical protein